MRKNAVIITGLCLILMTAPGITGLAAEYPERTGYGAVLSYQDNKDMPAYCMLTENDYIIRGEHVIDRKTGDIYYYPDYSEVFKNGIGNDGYAYDADGKQMSAAIYILNKYSDRTENGQIVFDNENNMDLYIRAMLQTEGSRQGGRYNYDTTGSGLPYIEKSEIKKLIGSTGTAYNEYIQQEALKINPQAGTKEKIRQVGKSIIESVNYDYDTMYDSLNDVINTKRGVCFHYVRIMEDVLNSLGIKCEPLSGTHRGENHLWLRAWDDENGTWIYLDLTEPKYPGDYGVIDMETYLDEYIQAGVS